MRSVIIALLLLAPGLSTAFASKTSPQSTMSSSSTSTTTNATCSPIEQFGGGVAVSDNSSALTTALSDLGNTGGCISFGAGKYVFTSPVSYTFPTTSNFGVRITGSSEEATILNWTSGSGLAFTSSSLGAYFKIENLTISTSSVGGSSIGFTANGPTTGAQPLPMALSSLTDVSFHGDDCYACTNYWGTAIYLNSWSNINIVSPSITGAAPNATGYSSVGIGIHLNSSSTPQGVQYNIFGGNIQYLLYGIEYGGYSQGLTVNQTNFVGSAYGIYIPSDASVDQMNVSNSQFSNSVANIADTAGLLYDQLSNNLFIEPAGSTGAYLEVNDGFNITGNTFVGPGSSATKTDGIIINKHKGSSGIITGNLFTSLNIGAWLASSSSNVSLQSNVYNGNGTDYLNNGTNNSVGVATP